MQNRLETLRKEFEAGGVELEKVEKQRAYLRDTMLRIEGAIRVLEEFLPDGDSTRDDAEVTDEGHAARVEAGQSGI
jgi:hypothetical protein